MITESIKTLLGEDLAKQVEGLQLGKVIPEVDNFLILDQSFFSKHLRKRKVCAAVSASATTSIV